MQPPLINVQREVVTVNDSGRCRLGQPSAYSAKVSTSLIMLSKAKSVI